MVRRSLAPLPSASASPVADGGGSVLRLDVMQEWDQLAGRLVLWGALIVESSAAGTGRLERFARVWSAELGVISAAEVAMLAEALKVEILIAESGRGGRSYKVARVSDAR